MSYSDRVWLNPPDKRSSGSAFAYAGPASWKDSDGAFREEMLLEIADCSGKIRLHKTDADTTEDFIEKLETLEWVLRNFIFYLRNENV